MWFMSPDSHGALLEFNKHMHILNVQCKCDFYKPGNIAGLAIANLPHLLIIQAVVFRIPKMPAEHCSSTSPWGYF